MQLNSEEVKFLLHVLKCSGNYTIAQAEQNMTPGIKRKDIEQKLQNYYHRLHQ